MDTALIKLQELVNKDSKYSIEAYAFVLAALGYTMKKVNPPRHITGREFCEGLRGFGLDQFGPLACQVLNYWGIRETLDFGHIVFALVEAGLMRKTQEDSLADFSNIYEFDAAFPKKMNFESE